MAGDSSWKHSRNSSSKRPAASHKSWQPGKAASASHDPHRKVRRLRVGAGIFGALIISGIVIAILLWRPTKAASFVVIAPSAPVNTVSPLNAGGFQAASVLAEWGADQKEIPNPKPKVDSTITVENWESVIDRNDTSKTPLVLSFAVPGGANPAGPFLWMVPEKAKVAEPVMQLPVKKILSVLKNASSDRAKVLIFDTAYESANWTRGEFSNDFARGLKSLDAEIAQIPNLVVICSADVDQTAWVSEEWRSSVFGHFLVEGLRGGAAPNDHHITVEGLLQYLSTQVSGWAQANRDAPQTPWILPAETGPKLAKEIRLLSVDTAKYQVKDAASAPGLSTDVPVELRKLWDRTAELANHQPRPEATSVHLWRQYLDLAIRSEVIARQTGTIPAANMAHLAKIDRELIQLPWAKTPECLANSFPVAKAMGQPVAKRTPGLLERLRNLPAAEQTKEWDQYTGPREAGLNTLVAELLEQLAKQATISPADIDGAISLLKQLDALRDRQSEVQLLRIFHNEKDRPMASGADIALALKVHLAGEQTAWFTTSTDDFTYPEQVARWLSKPLASADELRRTGIDLLFSSAQGDWANGRDRLKRAESQYATLQTEIAKLAQGYRVRDELQTRLPYYAFWVAQQRKPFEDTPALLLAIQSVAGKLHELSRLLAEPKVERLEEVSRITRLIDPTNEASAYTSIVKRFQKEIDELSQSTTLLPSDWHRLDNALRVPFITPSQRALLYRRLKTTSNRLHSSTTSQQAGASDFSPRQLAIRHSRLALAIAGAGLIDEHKLANSPSWTQLNSVIDGVDADQWAKTLSEVGEQLASIYRSLPEKTQQAINVATRTDGDLSQQKLAVACRYAGSCDGCVIITENPVAADRRVWMHSLLLSHAIRSNTDGWAEIDAGAAKSYARRVAELYVQTAEDVILNGEALDTITKEKRLSDVLAVRSQLIPPKFAFGWEQSTLDLTDRPEEKPRWRIAATRATGFPVVRLTSIAKPLGSKTIPVGQGYALTQFEKPRTDEALVPVTLTVDREGKTNSANGQVTAELFYRGERLIAPLKSQSFGQPTYTWINRIPSERRAMISITGDESLMSGSVAILFDGSGSMNNAKDEPENARRKYYVAADAVRDLLTKLPKDAYVSVSAFAGDAAGNLNLTPLQPPRVWNEPERFSKDVHAKLVNAVDYSRGAKTPLAKAIIHARDVGNRELYFKEGFKNLIVITDGDDNVEDGNPGDRVLKFLRQPNQVNSDVAVHVVLFGTSKDDDASARAQFQTLTDEGNYADTQTPAMIWPREGESQLRSKDELLANLRAAMLPRVQLLHRDWRRPERVPISLIEANTKSWLERGLEPGVYSLRTADESRRLELQPADRLALTLKREAGKLVLSLPSYADARRVTLPEKRDAASDTVRMTVPRLTREPLEGREDLETLVTLEKPINNRADQLRRELPQFIWFEMTPADSEKLPSGLRIENQFERIAPVWKVTSHTWVPQKGQSEVAIAPAHPKIEGFWLERWPEGLAKATVELKSLSKLTEELAKLPSRKFSIQGVGEIELDDLTIDGKYLTVRLKYPAGSLVVPQAVKLLGQGQDQRWLLEEEHRWYAQAGVCVSRFGPLPDDLKVPLTLDFYSLQAIKKTAQRVEIIPKNQPELDQQDLLPKKELPGR